MILFESLALNLKIDYDRKLADFGPHTPQSQSLGDSGARCGALGGPASLELDLELEFRPSNKSTE